MGRYEKYKKKFQSKKKIETEADKNEVEAESPYCGFFHFKSTGCRARVASNGLTTV